MSRKLRVAAVLSCLMIITLTACGRGDLTGDNGVEVAMFEHTFRIWKSFSEQGGESDYNKTYGDGKGQAIVAYAATANHAGIEANMDHMLPMLAEECGISRQKMETEPAELDGHEESVLFIWNYTVKGVDATACGIAIKDADSMLYIVETSDGGKKDTLKEEVLAIANTVKYTGTYQTTKKENYPYRVENGDFAVNVTEGYECIHTDGDLLNIRYTNARTYEAGSSFFQVKKLDAAGQSLQQKAEETASKLDENAEAAKAEEKKVRDIWPDAAENVAASPVWCVSSVKNQLYFEHYFLEVGGEFYYMQICYPEDDSKAMEDMRKLFYGVEFASIGEESPSKEESPKTTEAPGTDASDSTASSTYAGKEPCLTFSGKSEDNVEVKENSYYEGSNYVIYLKKGAKVPGNLPQMIERIMKEDEELYGLSYEKGTNLSSAYPWRTEYFGSDFAGLNADNKKVNILIIPEADAGEIPWSNNCAIMLYAEELYQDESFDTTYHELAHVLRLRQGPNLGQAMEEGVGLYAQDRISRLENFPTWSMIQYCDSNGYQSQYDASKIIADPEGEFRRVALMDRTAEQEFYHYGFRFVTFLMQTYGPDAVAKVTEVSKKYSFEEKDVDTIVRVIKEAFGDDVFTKFGEWLPTGWKAWCDDYCAYMKQFGLE